MPSIADLVAFLHSGDYFGLIQAIYVSAFQSADLFYSVVGLLLGVGTYLRTKSVAYMAIIWILIGTLIEVAMPLASPVAYFLMIMGIASILFRLLIVMRS